MNPIVFVVLAAILIGLAFYLVALPLMQESRRNARPAPVISEQERLGELLAQRDSAFQALRELDFDYRVGKITDHDFSAFEANLKQHAAQLLHALDTWEAGIDDDLGAEIERAIGARKALFSDQLPELAPDGRTCSRCGKPALEGDKFCGGCGAELPAIAQAPVAAEGAQPVCPKCGQPHQPGDKFCAKCGQSLVAEIAAAAQ